MGGGVKSSCSFSSSPDDHSSLDDDQSHCSSDGLGLVEEALNPSGVEENSSNQVPFAGNLKRWLELIPNMINSYRVSLARIESLYEAKKLVLSYSPGSWIDKEEGEKLSDFDVPKATTLLVVGFKGSGKSSLINRISRVFEDDKLASDRAQVSYCSCLGDGTCFLHGYLIPRRSGSFCLFDTRSLSDQVHDNDDLIKRWMTNGVRHGDLVIRESDNSSLRDTLECKIRYYGNALAEPVRKVNFVIFVVDGLSVLRCMKGDTEEDARRPQMLARTFNSPYFSFRDDKPAVVVTRGDLLSDEERAGVRIYLGELLGVTPVTQIYDIPESDDPATELAILEMLKYTLERADKNLPRRSWARRNLCPTKASFGQVYKSCFMALIFLGLAMGMKWSNSPLHPAQTQYCNYDEQPPTTRETNQTVNLDLLNSTSQPDSSQHPETRRDLLNLTAQSNSSQSAGDQPTKPENPTPSQRKVTDKPRKPKTRSAEHKSRARKQREAAVSEEPTISWEARQRLWLDE